MAVLYLLTEIETETEMVIFLLSETELFCKMETKYKRESEHVKRYSNWNEIDFTMKIVM